MPLDTHKVDARSGSLVDRRRDVVLPGLLSKQRRCTALAVVELEDYKVERVSPRCEHLGAAVVVANCGESPVVAVLSLPDIDGAWPVGRSHAAVEGPAAIAVVADALLGHEARQPAG